MGISLHPCKVTMPPERTDCDTVLDFLIAQFPRIASDVWLARMQEGKVHWEDRSPVNATDVYVPHKRIFYYREVEQEPVIPFTEEIIYQDEHILVACKPHFLPVTPGGIYVEECLLNRLRKSTGIETLAPMHRIDRETAGLVLFSINPVNHGLYHGLFLEDGLIRKTYRAVGRLTCVEGAPGPEPGQQWRVENRIETGTPWFRMAITTGVANARSVIRCLSVGEQHALFELQPLSGKTHQLRLHLTSLGWPIANDRLYPELQPKSPDNFTSPLQLQAWKLSFTDPVTGLEHNFTSPRTLSLSE